MDEHELLIMHAERWARDHNRSLNPDLLGHGLQLRAMHDELAANRWPAGSVTHLMLTRWPSHGPDCPEPSELVGSLDTFWRFLRSTGRMAGASADPSALLREAKTAAKKMSRACADEANWSPTKQIMGFGSELGITFDDVPDIDEANARLQQVMTAWNDLPIEERQRRSPPGSGVLSPLGGTLTQAALSDPAGLTLPGTPRLDEPDDDEELMVPSDPALSGPQVRGSAFARQVLELAGWVGDGQQTTAIGVLRPAIAERAYRDLELWRWDNEYSRARYGAESLPLTAESPWTWRSASHCLALDRLWLAAEAAQLITAGKSRAVANLDVIPANDLDWVRFGFRLLLGVLDRMDETDRSVLIRILLWISEQYGRPSTVAELKQLWWDDEDNPMGALDGSFRAVESGIARMVSDHVVAGVMALVADCALWTMRRGRLAGTEWGWDVVLMLVMIDSLQLEA